MERRLEVVLDPRNDELRRVVECVSGIGSEWSWAVAEAFESEADLASASRDDLEAVPDIGEKRAASIRERVAR
ncbi:helix-hairpin-helix domain-containing protein [Halorarum salinum]|uniref:Helix-hairpin-helix domain-containing protein n=1 Tax=Halorarum salinum TaxID=2743089 RepID=A0A7D5LAN5_9EURY|nr:helix-hairpin-helix domain-containing protein [Halobaculum salinum]QLG62192.1 hypothetical protein HUG12_10790 [Halobaculum salinum]